MKDNIDNKTTSFQVACSVTDLYSKQQQYQQQ